MLGTMLRNNSRAKMDLVLLPYQVRTSVPIRLLHTVRLLLALTSIYSHRDPRHAIVYARAACIRTKW